MGAAWLGLGWGAAAGGGGAGAAAGGGGAGAAAGEQERRLGVVVVRRRERRLGVVVVSREGVVVAPFLLAVVVVVWGDAWIESYGTPA